MDTHLLNSKERQTRDSQFDLAVSIMEKLIFSGDIKAGEKLPSEREFVTQYGVSRTVWREALRALEARGLIRVAQGRGVYVQKPGLWTVIDPMHQLLRDQMVTMDHLMKTRSILEPEIARLASLNAQETHIKTLEQDCVRMAGALDYPEQYVAADKDFHNHLAFATGNPVLAITIWPIITLIPGFVDLFHEMPGVSREVFGHHEKILAAVKSRDPDAAEAAMRKHLQDIIELFRNYSDEDFSIDRTD